MLTRIRVRVHCQSCWVYSSKINESRDGETNEFFLLISLRKKESFSRSYKTLQQLRSPSRWLTILNSFFITLELYFNNLNFINNPKINVTVWKHSHLTLKEMIPTSLAAKPCVFLHCKSPGILKRDRFWPCDTVLSFGRTGFSAAWSMNRYTGAQKRVSAEKNLVVISRSSRLNRSKIAYLPTHQ